MIILGPRSKARADTCKPALRDVIYRAAHLAPLDLDFTVLEGVRSRDQMKVNYGKGRTAMQLVKKGISPLYAKPNERKVTWLNDPFASTHAADPEDGLSKAVDLAPWPINWNDSARFEKLARHVIDTGKSMGVRLKWGRDWDMDGRYEEKGETDGPHFELV